MSGDQKENVNSADPQPTFVDFECPGCGKEIGFPTDWAGSVQECAYCGRSLVVPEKSKAPVHEIRLDIRTPRLLLRRLCQADRDDLLGILSDGELFRYSDWRTMDSEDVDKWLKSDAKLRLVQSGTCAYFGIELTGAGKLIGLVSFDYYSEANRSAGFELALNRGFHRQGYGAEAVRGIMDFAFGEMNLHRIVAVCFSANLAVCKTLERGGMRREGEYVESRKLCGEWANRVTYAELQREWRANRPS